MNAQRKAIFLDRDGIINVDHGYVYKISELEIYQDLPEFLLWANAMGFLVLAITNQSGVARGKFNLYDVFEFHRVLNQKLRVDGGIGLAAFYICPHLPEGIIPEYSLACTCRKPGTALIHEAAQAWNIDLAQSWLIGDKLSDMRCAINAKLKPIFMPRGQKKQEKWDGLQAQDLTEAKGLIL